MHQVFFGFTGVTPAPDREAMADHPAKLKKQQSARGSFLTRSFRKLPGASSFRKASAGSFKKATSLFASSKALPLPPAAART